MKITIDRSVLEQALDALENNAGEYRVSGAKAILRKALAQPAAQPTEPSKDICVEQDERVFTRIAAMKAQQEPAGEPVGVVVATRWNADGVTTRYEAAFRPSAGVKAGDMLYIRPAVPLTRERVADLWIAVADIEHATDRQIAYARAIEPAHKIGGAE
jgi:hypothetical protein